jgi:hypothetical protein
VHPAPVDAHGTPMPRCISGSRRMTPARPPRSSPSRARGASDAASPPAPRDARRAGCTPFEADKAREKEQAMTDAIDTPRGTEPERTPWPPWVTLVIGIWLIISAFAWPHALTEQTNAWIVGMLIALAAVVSMFAPSVRYIATLLSIWLFFSAIAFTSPDGGTPWHDVIAAIVVFLVSLIPTTTPHATGGGRPVHA